MNACNQSYERFYDRKKSKVVKIGGRINPTDPISLGFNNRQQIDLIDL